MFQSKSFSRIIQSIGRALRLHFSKKEAHVVDVRFNFKYSKKHYDERLKYYKEVYGKKQPDEVINIEIWIYAIEYKQFRNKQTKDSDNNEDNEEDDD